MTRGSWMTAFVLAVVMLVPAIVVAQGFELPYQKSPDVEEIFPANGAHEVSPTTEIRLRLKKAIDPELVEAGMASIAVMQFVGGIPQKEIDGEVSYDAKTRTLVWKGEKKLPADRKFQVVAMVMCMDPQLQIMQYWTFDTKAKPAGNDEPKPDKDGSPAEPGAKPERAPEKAAPKPETAVDTGPTDAELLSAKFWIAEAEKSLASPEVARSDRAGYYLLRVAALHMCVGDPERALKIVESLAENLKSEGHLVLARIALERGDTSFASRRADAILGDAEYLPEQARRSAKETAASLLALAGRGGDAARIMKEAKRSETALLEALALEAVANPKAAEADLPAFDLEHNRPELFATVAYGYALGGDLRSARRLLENARREKGNARSVPGALLALGLVAAEEGDRDAATWASTALQGLKEGRDAAAACRVLLAARVGDFDAAWAQLRENDDPLARLAMTVEAVRQGNATWEKRLVPGVRELPEVKDWRPVTLCLRRDPPMLYPLAEVARAYAESGRMAEGLSVVPAGELERAAARAAGEACASVAKVAAERGDMETYRTAVGRAISYHFASDSVFEAQAAAGDDEGIRGTVKESSGIWEDRGRLLAAYGRTSLLRSRRDLVQSRYAGASSVEEDVLRIVLGAAEGRLGVELDVRYPGSPTRVLRPLREDKKEPKAKRPEEPVVKRDHPTTAAGWLAKADSSTAAGLEPETAALLAWTFVLAGDEGGAGRWIEALPQLGRRAQEWNRLAERYLESKDWKRAGWCAGKMEALLPQIPAAHERRSIAKWAAEAYAGAGDTAAALRMQGEPGLLMVFEQQKRRGNLAAAQETVRAGPWHAGVLVGSLRDLAGELAAAGLDGEADGIADLIRTDPRLREYRKSYDGARRLVLYHRARRGDAAALDALGGPAKVGQDSVEACVVAMARKGDIEGAEALATKVDMWGDGWTAILAEAIRRGDSGREARIATQMKDRIRPAAVVVALAERGRLADAVRTLEAVRDRGDRVSGILAIARAQAKANSSEECKAALAMLDEEGSFRYGRLDEILELRAAIGDLAGLRKELTMATDLTQLQLAWIHVKYGDPATTLDWIDAAAKPDEKAQLCAGAAWAVLGVDAFPQKK